jgi:hypothetical protein
MFSLNFAKKLLTPTSPRASRQWHEEWISSPYHPRTTLYWAPPSLTIGLLNEKARLFASPTPASTSKAPWQGWTPPPDATCVLQRLIPNRHDATWRPTSKPTQQGWNLANSPIIAHDDAPPEEGERGGTEGQGCLQKFGALVPTRKKGPFFSKSYN